MRNAIIQKLLDEYVEGDNSFVYLEKHTLRLLLAHLLTGEKPTYTPNEGELDQLLVESKVQFEEILQLLKEVQHGE
ncbi:hypothetical protein [Lysinibacillus piscis]|uniref:Uncharacterized protein n=1 Tax=Lysinibacillus piscis TaxID=2518931 RepID=A0ABQ5NMF4_9BACI|nr:hypothetical protein [Lysinibacillus sp. KH24]GLC89514.1 hypothetical protein LYSBPC_26410 [Lysinibacillus sp. KH24]